MQQLLEKYYDNQLKIMIDSSANELQVSRETPDKIF